LEEYLPQNFPLVVQILIDSLGPESNEAALTGSDGFIIMLQCNFVAKFGPDYLDVSMKVLDEMTQRFTAKGSIEYSHSFYSYILTYVVIYLTRNQFGSTFVL
jgi:hypothetical protein